MAPKRGGPARSTPAVPRLQIAQNLPRVDLEVLGVGFEPLPGGVRLGVFGVTPGLRPGRLGKAPDERGRPGPDRLNLAQRQIEGGMMVVECAGPAVMVVALDHRRRLSRLVADAHRRD